MIDEETLKKVQRLYHCKTVKKNPSQKKYTYRVWWGFWKEGGKTKKVYFGSELPDKMKEMLRQVKPSTNGIRNKWPRSVHGKNAGDPGLLQVGGR
jgi:hypothetical protein